MTRWADRIAFSWYAGVVLIAGGYLVAIAGTVAVTALGVGEFRTVASEASQLLQWFVLAVIVLLLLVEKPALLSSTRSIVSGEETARTARCGLTAVLELTAAACLFLSVVGLALYAPVFEVGRSPPGKQGNAATIVGLGSPAGFDGHVALLILPIGALCWLLATIFR